jgi:hypothetical protein
VTKVRWWCEKCRRSNQIESDREDVMSVVNALGDDHKRVSLECDNPTSRLNCGFTPPPGWVPNIIYVIAQVDNDQSILARSLGEDRKPVVAFSSIERADEFIVRKRLVEFASILTMDFNGPGDPTEVFSGQSWMMLDGVEI